MSDTQSTKLGGQSDLTLASKVVELLFVNGQTTERLHFAVSRIGSALRPPLRFVAHWGDLIIQSEDRNVAHVLAAPSGVDIGRVIATEQIVDDFCARRIGVAESLARLSAVERLPPVSLVRFAIMAGAGAAALGVIFGASDTLTLVVIALSAGAGACLRRAVSHLGRNPFAQPFLAALLAGVIASAANLLELRLSLRFIAVCPCMVLVPGPHFLNATIDLARARIPLGIARLTFATLVVLAISSGLLAGLALTTASLPSDSAPRAVALVYDIGAAGIAVAAYGSFFNMPWAMLPAPICIGVAAHALRWEMLSTGASVPLAAFMACLLVGVLTAPLAHRLRVPFGPSAFAAVVSLIPGVYMFEMASETLNAISRGSAVSTASLIGLAGSGMTALTILFAMTVGLIMPKMLFDHVLQRLTGHPLKG